MISMTIVERTSFFVVAVVMVGNQAVNDDV